MEQGQKCLAAAWIFLSRPEYKILATGKPCLQLGAANSFRGLSSSPASHIFWWKAFIARGTCSNPLALLLLSPPSELLPVPVHRLDSAPTPGQWLPAVPGKDSRAKLALTDLKI